MGTEGKRVGVFVLAIVFVFSPRLSATAAPPPTDVVTMHIVALGTHDQSVADLTSRDFQVSDKLLRLDPEVDQ